MRRAFTLIEVLVVIAVIVILIGLSFPAYSAVKRSSQRKTTRAFLERVTLACSQYEQEWGDYPPSNPARVGLPSNGRNDGIEALLRCLTTAKKSGPYLTDIEDGQLKNADGDELKSADPTGSSIAVKSLYELTDPWGNPIAYIHNSEYAKGANVQLASGATVRVAARKSDVTGQYAELTKVQLISAGPDEEFDTDDDVTSWGD